MLSEVQIYKQYEIFCNDPAVQCPCFSYSNDIIILNLPSCKLAFKIKRFQNTN